MSSKDWTPANSRAPFPHSKGLPDWQTPLGQKAGPKAPTTSG
ncbi:MAG: hypothetical protein VKJ04_07510 [Vampirovibrionales bacterium]|nr:hypothetical protein [Vampirovibrionales bacterium]